MNELSNLNHFPVKIYILFMILIIIAIIIDLFMHRNDSSFSLKKTIILSIFWIIIAIIFSLLLYNFYNPEMASLFITSYIVEEFLSLDNLFVMMSIFNWFKVPNKYRYRVLYWGIIGAIIFRGIFIALGTAIFKFGPYIEIIFALVICWTAITMIKNNYNDKYNKVINYSKYIYFYRNNSILSIWPKINSNAFLLSQKEVIKELSKPENKNVVIDNVKHKYYATPLLLCLILIELSDLIFAFDSIPAIIAISCEPLIIYSAVIFAILSLRTFYFLLESFGKKYMLHLERTATVLLFFIALKLIINAINQIWKCEYFISNKTSLTIMLIILALFGLITFYKKK